MTIEDLKRRLGERGIDLRNIYFGDGLPIRTDQYVIQESHGLWEVYHFERGERREERTFESETSACTYLLSVLLGDRAIQKKE